MRFIHFVASAIALSAASISAQQSPSSSVSTPQTVGSSTAIYDASAEVISPVLLPSQPVEITSGRCKRKNGETNDVRFSMYVTSDGRPRRIIFMKALGNNLDQKALDLVNADRFTPGSRNGEQVAVWQTIDVVFKSCLDNANGKAEFLTFRMSSQPLQKLSALQIHPTMVHVDASIDSSDVSAPHKVGGRVRAPLPLMTPEAHFSTQARKKRIQGECLLSLVVDAQGMPRNAHILRGIGYGLDENALDAVTHYRFKPALLDNFEPVPVQITVLVNFRLY